MNDIVAGGKGLMTGDSWVGKEHVHMRNLNHGDGSKENFGKLILCKTRNPVFIALVSAQLQAQNEFVLPNSGS